MHAFNIITSININIIINVIQIDHLIRHMYVYADIFINYTNTVPSWNVLFIYVLLF